MRPPTLPSLAAALCLSAACASTPPDERFLVLESDAYG